jgi:hypothetical protein
MENEIIWKNVPSKIGVMANNLGQIKLPDSEASMPNGGKRTYKTKPVFGTKAKASKNARHVFYSYWSPKYGHMKVHRLVCEAFHGPPPFDRAVVIHIDENALNNRPENLRWGTQKENLNMPGFIAYCKSRTGENNPAIKGRKKKV